MYLKALEKQKQSKSQDSRWRQIIKSSEKINELEMKNYKESINEELEK